MEADALGMLVVCIWVQQPKQEHSRGYPRAKKVAIFRRCCTEAEARDHVKALKEVNKNLFEQCTHEAQWQAYPVMIEHEYAESEVTV